MAKPKVGVISKCSRLAADSALYRPILLGVMGKMMRGSSAIDYYPLEKWDTIGLGTGSLAVELHA